MKKTNSSLNRMALIWAILCTASGVAAQVLVPGDIVVVDPSALGGAVIHVDPASGVQTEISSGGLLSAPRGVAIDGAGQLIVAESTGSIVRVDPETGAQTEVSSGGSLVTPLAVAIDEVGTLLIADAGPPLLTGSLIAVDPDSGVQTVLSTGGSFVDPHGVAIDRAGTVYVSEHHIDSGTTGAVIEVDTGTGVQTVLSSGGDLHRVVHVAINGDGNPVAVSLASTSAVVEVDAVSGAQTLLSSAGSLVDPSGVAIDESGNVIVADNSAFGGSGGVIEVDPGTGAQTTISSGDLFVDPQGVAIVPPLCGSKPRVGCRTAGKSIIKIKNHATSDKKDLVIWKWIKGQSTSQSDFGDPTDTTWFGLCVYEAPSDDLVAGISIPASASNWAPIGDKGFKYRDKSGLPDGAQKAILKGSDNDRAKALLKGKGENLPDPPAASLTLPVTVQLVTNNTGVCFESTFDADDVRRNEPGSFKAKAQ